MIYTGYIALQDWNTMAEVLYQRWSFLYVGVYQWPLVQTFSSLICFRWKFPSLLQRGLRQRMICYCWYVTNFGDQVGLTTNAALQKEWSHQLALWISYQGTGDDDHRNITEYHHYPGQLNSWPCHWLSQSVILQFQHLQSTADLSKTHVTFLTIEWL